jgi:hypothetical protein
MKFRPQDGVAGTKMPKRGGAHRPSRCPFHKSIGNIIFECSKSLLEQTLDEAGLRVQSFLGKLERPRWEFTHHLKADAEWISTPIMVPIPTWIAFLKTRAGDFAFSDDSSTADVHQKAIAKSSPPEYWPIGR